MRGEVGKKVFVVAHTPVGASEDEGRRRMNSRRAERPARSAPKVNAGLGSELVIQIPHQKAARERDDPDAEVIETERRGLPFRRHQIGD